ncbi:hypothetical protein [Paraburkholderia sp.]|uniref:hypothetical protein n=1 Tax=Paraburkholderia sp. TaxID=1926495 RepID=UPI0039E6079F
MIDYDRTAEGMLGGLISWLVLEGRDLSHYSVSRFVCEEMMGATADSRSKVARALYELATRPPIRYPDQGSW